MDFKEIIKARHMTGLAGGGVAAPDKGIIFEEWDSDGFPHKARVVGLAAVRDYQCYNYTRNANTSLFGRVEQLSFDDNLLTLNLNSFNSWIGLKKIEFPDVGFRIRDYVFSSCTALEEVTIPAAYIGGSTTKNLGTKCFGDCTSLEKVTILCPELLGINQAFYGCDAVMEYDFSSMTMIPTITATADIGHASGCVIKVPSSLLDDWQAATNWCDLTDVVWQGV